MPTERDTSVTYPGDGSTTLWDFNFVGGYLDKAHVKAKSVAADGSITNIPITSDNFVTDFRLSITPAVDVGLDLVIYRSTPRAALVNWLNRAQIDRAGLDITAKQALFVAAENSEDLESINDAVLAAEQAAEDAAASAAAAAGADDAAATATAAAATATAAQVAVQAIYDDILANPPADAGITAVLTRDSVVFAADSAGTVTDFSVAAGKMNVYDGNTAVPDASVAYSVVTALGVTLSINSTGNYTVTGMSSDFASATLRGAYAGVNRDKRLTFAKARAGVNGTNGTDGVDGVDGAPGNSGFNTVLLTLYKRSVSAPSGLSGDVGYTFSTGVATGLTNGWARAIPAGTDPIWSISGSAVSTADTDTIAAAEFTTPVKIAESGTGGADGMNGATVFLFQRTLTSTPPAKPSATVTYTFATGVATGVNNGWSQTLPTSGGGYRWLTTATAVSQVATDTIPNTEWADVAAIGENGVDGQSSANVLVYKRAAAAPALPSATCTYTFNTAVLTGLNNGWTQAIPAGTDKLWVTVASAVSQTATDTIAAGEWTPAVEYVSNGLNTATVFLYKRTTADVAPAGPTATITYTFATGVATGLTNGWTQGIPDAAGGGYLWITTATVASTGTTDTIPNTEWATVRRFAIDGASGVDAKSLRLMTSAQTFTYDSDNVTANPSGQVITFTAVLANLAGTGVFVCTRYNSAGASLGTVTLGGAGTNVRTLTAAQFGTAAYATVSVTLSGLTDTETVVRLRAGTDGQSTVVADLDNQAHTLPATSAGVVTSYTGAATRMSIFVGLIDDSTNWTFTRVVSTGVTANLGTGVNKNLLTVTAVATDTESGYVDITATRAGYPTQVKRFTLAKSRSAEGTSGVTANGSALAFDLDLVGSAAASIQVKTDGEIWGTNTTSGLVFRKNWYSPGAPGSSYWIRAVEIDAVNGTWSGSAFGSWLQLNVNRTWTFTTGAGSGSGLANVEYLIATDAAGANIVGGFSGKHMNETA